MNFNIYIIKYHISYNIDYYWFITILIVLNNYNILSKKFTLFKIVSITFLERENNTINHP